MGAGVGAGVGVGVEFAGVVHAPLLRLFPVWHEVQVVFELQERQVEGQLVQGLV